MSDDGHPSNSVTGKSILLAVLVMLTVGAGGGFLTGLAVDQFGEVGSVVVWLVGFAAGLLGIQLGLRGDRVALGLIILGLAVAGVVAETCWMRWNIQQAKTWSDAIRLLPKFVQQYRTSAFVMVIFIVFGALSAFHQLRR